MSFRKVTTESALRIHCKNLLDLDDIHANPSHVKLVQDIYFSLKNFEVKDKVKQDAKNIADMIDRASKIFKDLEGAKESIDFISVHLQRLIREQKLTTTSRLSLHVATKGLSVDTQVKGDELKTGHLPGLKDSCSRLLSLPQIIGSEKYLNEAKELCVAIVAFKEGPTDLASQKLVLKKLDLVERSFIHKKGAKECLAFLRENVLEIGKPVYFNFTPSATSTSGLKSVGSSLSTESTQSSATPKTAEIAADSDSHFSGPNFWVAPGRKIGHEQKTAAAKGVPHRAKSPNR